MNKKYFKWDISQGDYEREYDSPLKYTDGYIKRQKVLKVIKVAVGSAIALGVIATIIASCV